MPAEVLYKLSAVHGKRIKNGEEKNNYVNVGVAMRAEGHKEPFIKLDGHINFSALGNPDRNGDIILSCFPPDNNKVGVDSSASAYAQAKGKSVPATPQQRTPSEKLAAINSQASMDFDDDDMPF